MSFSPPRPAGTLRLPTMMWLALTLAGVSADAVAQGFGLLRNSNADQPAAALAVPDPAALKPGWWNYLAPQEPGIEARIEALLAQASQGAMQLPPAQATPAAQAVERLRISLSALPAMLAAQPAVLPELPAPQAAYTTTTILELDRDIRDLQEERDERRSAMKVAERAIKDGQRQEDAVFARYLASSGDAPAHALQGLQIMASRAEIAVTQAEVKLRSAEADLLTTRIRELTALRDDGSTRIVPDPERQPEQIQALIARNQAQLEKQRGEILRTRAQRSELASRAKTTKAANYLADMHILTAMIEESVLVTRIELYETEIDWLTIAAGGLDSAAIAALDQRLEQRRSALDLTDKDLVEWVAEIERLIAVSLRQRSGAATNGDIGTIDAMVDLGRAAISRISRLRSLQADVRFAITGTLDQLARSAGWRGWLQTQVFKRGGVTIRQTGELLGTSLFRIGDAPVTTFGLLRVLLIMAAAIFLSRLARHLLARFAASRQASAGLYTVGRLLHYVLITAGLMIGLSSIGLDFSQLALVAGALSIGIGFGLQSVVNNFVSGLMILFEQSLKIGDVVELDSGVRGVVREISVRSTLIATSDGVDIIVPNSEFVAGKVINFTLREPFHRIHVPFGVAYSSDKEQVRAVVIEAARAVAFTHAGPGREPDVWLVRFGDNSLDFELVVWINPAAVTRPGAVMATYLWEIESALRQHGIEIPFPQRDVHLRVSAAEVAAAGGASPPSTPAA